MDLIIWVVAAVAGCTFLVIGAVHFLPARVRIVIDTPTSTARAEMRPLWGMLPTVYARALPQTGVGRPLAVFSDVMRIGPALTTPGLSDAVYEAIKGLYALKPKLVDLRLALNLGDPAQNLVVQTGAQAAMAMAPVSLRERVSIGKCETPGAEFSMQVELTGSPARILAIRDRFRNSRAGREFQLRLKRKPKATKRPVREVRAT